jgi:hypothetical protein
LKKLIKSLSRQTFKDYELVFVDNNSTDNSLQLLNEMLAEESLGQMPVKIVQNKTNLGYCRGNNIGLEHAKAKYVLFLNNDTYVTEKWLEELVSVMDAYPLVGACQSRLVFPQTGEVQCDGFLLDKYGWEVELIVRNKTAYFSSAPFYVSGASLIVRKTAVEEANGFDSKLFYGDLDLCWRLRLLGYDVASTSRSICYHYGSVASQMLISNTKRLFNRDFEVVRVLLKNYSGSRVVRRIPPSVIIMFLEAGAMTLKHKDVSFLCSFLRAMLRNTRYLKGILLVRHRVQNHRKISDQEIEKRMLHYSAIISRRQRIETE